MGKNIGNGFGIAGFVLGLVGVLMFGYGFLFSLLGLIFSIIQMRKKKTGLSIAGLVLSIIGLAFLILIFGVTIIWAAIIPMISNSLGEGTSCLDAVATTIIESACIDGENIHVILMGQLVGVDQVGFIADGWHEDSLTTGYINRSITDGEYSIVYSELGLDSVITIEVAPIVSGKMCDISSIKMLESC